MLVKKIVGILMKVMLSIGLAGFLYGCASTPTSNELQVNRDGNTVAGSAGVDWTDEELRQNSFKAICRGDGEVVSEMSIERDSSGNATFQAACLKE